MNNRRRTTLVIALLLILAGVAVFVLRPREPTYQGKALSAWLEDLDGSGSAKENLAKEAVRHIGTNALPYLIPMLEARDSRVKQMLMAWSNKLWGSGVHFTPAVKRLWQATIGLEALGPLAKPASPALIDLFKDKDLHSSVIQVFLWIGVEAVPNLTQALTNQNPNVRVGAAMALSHIGSNAPTAIPGLIMRLKDKEIEVRVEAVSALGQIGLEAGQVVPALIEVLNGTNAHWSMPARTADSLGRFGTQAKAAIPALEKALQHPDRRVRRAAAAALEQIDPAAAARSR